jgi:hypothetical protein
MMGDIPPRRGHLADAVEALGLCAAAHTHRFPGATSSWQLLNWLTAGRLLAPSPSG